MSSSTTEKSAVHPTAIIAADAIIGENTSVGPYTVIESGVVLGKNNTVSPHVVISGNTKIGDNNQIFPFASIGTIPQDLKFSGEPSRLQIGSGNIIREYVTIQPGTKGGGMLTVVGDDNLFMASAHVAHDVQMGNRNIMVNNASLAGHIEVGDHVIMGGHSGYHQFIRLGDHVIISGGSIVTKDVPPYCTAQGDRAFLFGINKVGLERAGFTSGEIKTMQSVYRQIFLSNETTLTERLKGASEQYSADPRVSKFLSFLSESKRGFCHPRKMQTADA